MKFFFICICSVLLLVWTRMPVSAQAESVPDWSIHKWKAFYDQSCGADYNLINGIKYLNIYPSSDGHPFLGEDLFYHGKLVVNDKEYQNQGIKYDICNQQIVLQYRHFSGSVERIILVNEIVDEFEIQGKIFRKYTFPERNPHFYQVVAEGKVACLYFWKKDMVTGSSVDAYYRYLPEKKQSYLLIDSKLLSFRSKRSFVKWFPEAHHKNIKAYLKSNKISFGMASDQMMQQLLTFCNEINTE